MHTKRSLIVYTLSHFCVDFCCFFLLTGAFRAQAEPQGLLSGGYLLYNVVAFGLQAPVGFFFDGKSPRAPGVIGGVLMLLGLALPVDNWARMLICAVGNAFFHVGGGLDSLLYAKGRMARSGFFVSLGAAGVALGTLAGKSGAFPLWAAVSMMAAAFLAMLVWGDNPLPEDAGWGKPAAFPRPLGKTLLKGTIPVVLLCLFSIVVRAYGGGVLHFGWTSGLWAILPGLFSCLGKMAGGFLADRFGPRPVAVLSLIVSLPLLCFGADVPWLCLTGLFLFNMTMAITLCALVLRMPDRPGFAFGLSTMALLTGTVPLFLLHLSQTWARPILGAAILLSAAAVALSVPDHERSVSRDESV